MKGEEGTLKSASPKLSITYVRNPITRSTLAKQVKETLTHFQKGKGLLQETKTNLQEAKTVLQDTLLKLQEAQKLESKVGEQQEAKEEDQKMKEPNPQPNLDSYYQFIEGGKVIPQKFAIPFFFELEKERAWTHRRMHITKSKGVEDIGHMEEKLKEMGKELSGLRGREAIMRNQLEIENAWLRGQL